VLSVRAGAIMPGRNIVSGSQRDGGTALFDVGPQGVGVDVLAELRGQLAHDSSPLLLMALKAGAHVVTPEGKPMDSAMVEEALMRPADARLRYLAASSKALADSVVSRMGRTGLPRAA